MNTLTSQISVFFFLLKMTFKIFLNAQGLIYVFIFPPYIKHFKTFTIFGHHIKVFLSFSYEMSFKCMNGATEMAQQGKAHPKSPWDLYDERRELAPKNCPLISICVL